MPISVGYMSSFCTRKKTFYPENKNSTQYLQDAFMKCLSPSISNTLVVMIQNTSVIDFWSKIAFWR